MGMGNGLKGTGRGPYEIGLVRVSGTGQVSVLTGAAAIGQGLVTVLAQICASELGMHPRDVTVVSGDTAAVPVGLGAFASRQTVTAGSSVLLAARAVAAKAKTLAGMLMQMAPDDLELKNGEVRVQERAGAFDHARRARADPARRARAMAFRRGSSRGWRRARRSAPITSPTPMRCHVAEVEVDIDTGGVTHPALQRAARFRRAHQSDDGRRPDPRRDRARHRQRAVRVDGLRRNGPADHDDLRRLSAADRDRAAEDFDVVPGIAVAAQSARREGRGRDPA